MTRVPATREGRRLAAAVIALLTLPVLSSAGCQSLPPPSLMGEGVPATIDAEKRIPESFNSLGGYFMENRGQVTDGVRYYSNGNPSVAFRDDGVMLVVSEMEKKHGEEKGMSSDRINAPIPAIADRPEVRSLAFMLRFEGANEVIPTATERLLFRSNFFIGNNPRDWRTDVPNYRQVVYRDLYEGIDLSYRLGENGVKYEFVVHPGANPESILMRYEGVDSLQVDKTGVVVLTAIGQIRDSPPYAYQGAGEEVKCDFVLRRVLALGFYCNDWDSASSLTIDPLIYSTYLGGNSYEWGNSVAADPLGNAYVTGDTYSIDFPVSPGAFRTSKNLNEDVFVSKLNSAGNALVYSTFIGGSGWEGGNSIALDLSGKAYVVGLTSSSDFPTTPGAFDTSFNGDIYGSDAFVLGLNETGGGLVYSTYLGGGGRENGYGIKVDSAECAYVVGTTPSPDFPVTAGAFDTSYNGGIDTFVAKLDQAGTSLLYSTFLGGGDQDRGKSLTIDSIGTAYVVGYTYSNDFPVTPGSYETSFQGIVDAFVTKLNASGKIIDYSTYIGGTATDYGMSIVIDRTRNAYVAGATSSADFPTTPGVFDRTFNSPDSISDAFVLKLDATGSSIVYSSYLGGASDETGWSIAVDAVGEVFLTGGTRSSDFPVTSGAFDVSYNGGSAGEDAFVAKIDEDASTLLYSTYLGGTGDEEGYSINVDLLGDVYAAGYTYSSDFPTTSGAFDTTFNGQNDAFVVKLTPSTPDIEISTPDVVFNPPTPVLFGTSVVIDAAVHNIGDGNASDVVVRFHDGPPSVSNQIGTNQTIPFIRRSGGINATSMTWTADPPGMHDICVVADPDDLIGEMNETNNMACASVLVLASPSMKPDYVPVLTQPPPPVRIGASSTQSFSVVVNNQGNDTATANSTVAFYEQSSPPFSTFILGPLSPAAMSSRFTAKWTTPATPGTYTVSVDVDYYDNVTEWDETNNVYTWVIQVVSGPVTSLIVGFPNYITTVTYVRSTTPLDLSVLDQGGTGINHTKYRIDNLTWIEYSSSFFLPGEGEHYVEWYSEDRAGNTESTNSRILRVDDSPPATAISIGEPKYSTAGLFVKSSTPLTLTATDGGVGRNSTFYRLWDGSWSSWRDYTSSFNLAGRDGTWYVEFLSFDYLGNKEIIRNETLILDDTPPTTTLSPATGPYTIDTVFTFTATDTGCGVNATRYRIDGGSWTEYSDGFTLPEGDHNISYYSNDYLNNTEQVRWREVTVPGAPPTIPPPSVEANYKPLVALVFAIILAVVGIWSSKKRPWKGGNDRMAVAKAFAFTSLPIVLVESATGIVSFLSGELSIPPVVGLGTAIDLAILLAGIAVAVIRVIRKKNEGG